MTQTMKIVDGDWVLASTGQVEMVEGRVKVRQDLREMFSTNRLANGFGSGLPRLRGRVEDAWPIQAQIDEAVRAGVSGLRRLQNVYQYGQRPREERITGLVSVVVSSTAAGGGDEMTGFAYSAVVGVAEGTDFTLRGSI